MFKGIVEAVGHVERVEPGRTTTRLRVAAAELGAALAPGDSIAVDGACLTVTEADEAGFCVDVIGTTLARTIAGGYREGTPVNLERALELGSRIDGHLVQGHIDGVAHLMSDRKEGDFWLMDFRLPEDVASQTIARGSVALNGVSLTVAELLPDRVCRIGVIPFTRTHTNLGSLVRGDPVNVEGDLIGKYVHRVLAERGEASPGAVPPQEERAP